MLQDKSFDRASDTSAYVDEFRCYEDMWEKIALLMYELAAYCFVRIKVATIRFWLRAH